MLPATLVEWIDARRQPAHSSRGNQIRIELAESHRRHGDQEHGRT